METPTLEQLKTVHDLHLTTVQILTQRVQFYAEEFDAIKKLIEFYKLQAMDLRARIETLEQKKDDKEDKQSEPTAE